MDDGFIRLSIFGIFLLGYLRSSEVVVVVVVVFFLQRFYYQDISCDSCLKKRVS